MSGWGNILGVLLPSVIKFHPQRPDFLSLASDRKALALVLLCQLSPTHVILVFPLAAHFYGENNLIGLRQALFSNPIRLHCPQKFHWIRV